MSEDKDFIFPQGLIRGLGLLPKESRPKWPDAPKEPEGVGKEPEKEPEGVGAEPEGVGQGGHLMGEAAATPHGWHPGTQHLPGKPGTQLAPAAHAVVAKTNIEQAAPPRTSGTQHPAKFDPRGFWYTHGALPSHAPQKNGHGTWRQIGLWWVWCPTEVTSMPGNLIAVYQAGAPSGSIASGWTQVFDHYWVAPAPRIAVG